MNRELLQQALDALESLQGGCTDSNDGTVEAITVWCPELIDALRSALAAPQPEPEKRIVWCTETDSACSTCPTLRIPCQAATQAAALNARVTVPREPTQEMIAAGEAVFRSYCFRHVNGAIPTYEAMIAAVPAPAAPDLKHKPTVQRLMDLARKFRATPGDLYDWAYKELQQACYEALSAAPVVPLTDEQIDHLWDSHGGMPTERRPLEYNDLRLFARAVLSAAGAVREPKPAELLGMAVVDAIVDDGMRNAAGGIYATRVQEFAREVQIAFAQQNRVDLSGIGGGGK